MKAAAVAEKEAFMQHYKNYPIYATSVASHGGGWHSRGLVFDPKARPAKEIKRLDASERFSFTKEEAEALAFILCRAWIHGLAVAAKKLG